MKLPQKSGRWILAGIALVGLCFYLSGSSGIVNLYMQHQKMNAMAEDIQQLNHKIDSLRLVIKKLKYDTTYIEKIAREKLGMAKKNEKVYKFVEEVK